MKPKKVIPAIALVALGVALTVMTQENRSIGERVSALLAELPAGTAAERTRVAAGIVALGPAGIAEVCGRLAAPGAGG